MDKFKKFLTILICVIICTIFVGMWFMAGVIWFQHNITCL